MECTLLTWNSNEINRGVVAASVIVINVKFCQRRWQPRAKICIARLLYVYSRCLNTLLFHEFTNYDSVWNDIVVSYIVFFFSHCFYRIEKEHIKFPQLCFFFFERNRSPSNANEMPWIRIFNWYVLRSVECVFAVVACRHNVSSTRFVQLLNRRLFGFRFG